MPSAGLLISSGADSGYFPLLRDTVLSVLAQRRDAAIGILDFGLVPEQRDWLGERVAHLVRPGWDINFPGRERTPDVRKAQLSRPFCGAISPATRPICGSTRMRGCRTGVLSTST
jgi:hypothetical protein